MIEGRKRRALLLLAFMLAGSLLLPRASTTAAAGFVPADPALASYAQNVLERMVQYRGRFMLNGQQEIHSVAARKDEMSRAIYDRTSPHQYPSLRGWDYPFGSANAGDAQWMLDTIISDWNSARVLPTISQHWTPYGTSQGTYHPDMFEPVNIDNIFISGTQENTRYLAWRVNVASDLQQLEDAGVPVLWRPFHEAGGGWFWWDKYGPASYKRLWNDLWNYLTNTRGLHNLIWVWSVGTKNVSTEWYPQGKVDIIGHDVYGNTSGDYQTWYADLARFDASRLRTLSEVDTMPDPARLSDAPFAYFMVWHSEFLFRNSDSTIQSVYQHQRSVTRNRVSQYLNGALPALPPAPTATPLPTTTLYNFENASIQGWQGRNLYAGPWSVQEWAANGSSSLKADIVFEQRVADLHLPQAHNLAGKTRLQAWVRHAAWGNPGSGVVAKLFIKVRDGATLRWYDGGPVLISSASATQLTLNLGGIPNLDRIEELGVHFTAPNNSTGRSAIYVDYVTLQ